ncbi:DUF6455 family protein [Pseudahrensia aquimaris]|uniref:DUF6455 family protein n=1 Tax=Pseudahrensia aquimaris TaxID=744461 RepID=A0ABW3FGI0_9HYPH
MVHQINGGLRPVVFKPFSKRLDMLSKMANRTDALKRLGTSRMVEIALRRAMTTCLSCKSGDTCQKWQAENRGKGAAPEFCPNAARFEIMAETA